MLLFGCVLISEETSLLDTCFNFSKYLMLLFINIVTTGAWSLALFNLRVTSEVDVGRIQGLVILELD